MSKRIKSLLLSGLLPGIAFAGLAACEPMPTKLQDTYWQRIETHSALYLTGPKAQQQLEQNIAACVREVDELIRLQALRETTPPETNQEYRDALEKSGDLAAFDTPRHHKDLMVDHSDYYDFESCMRAKGWERVKAVRYQAATKAQQNHENTQELRKYGIEGKDAYIRSKKQAQDDKGDFNTLND